MFLLCSQKGGIFQSPNFFFEAEFAHVSSNYGDILHQSKNIYLPTISCCILETAFFFYDKLTWNSSKKS
jgi:hypothetical protein